MTDKSNTTKSYIITLNGAAVDLSTLPDYGCKNPKPLRGLSVQEQVKLIKSGQKAQR